MSIHHKKPQSNKWEAEELCNYILDRHMDQVEHSVGHVLEWNMVSYTTNENRDAIVEFYAIKRGLN